MALPIPSEMTATVGQILTAAEWNSNVRDGINYLLNPPLFVGVQSTVQSVASGAWGWLTIDTTTVDTYSGHSNATNNMRYTAQVAGWYEVTVGVSWASSGTGIRSVGVGVNSTTPIAASIESMYPGTAGYDPVCQTTYTVFLNVGDYVQGLVEQTSGAALSTNQSASGASFLAVRWVHQ